MTDKPTTAPLTVKEVARWILDSAGGGDWMPSCYARAERFIKRYEAQQVSAAINGYDALAASHQTLLEAAKVLNANADLTPDMRPQWKGSVDCYAVPFEDIESLRAAIDEAEKLEKGTNDD